MKLANGMWVSRFLIMGLVYLLAALIGIALTREGGNVAALWPPNAILVGVLLRAAMKDWPGYLGTCLVANGLANWLMGDTVAIALGFVLGNALEIVTFVAIVWRLMPLPVVLKTVAQPLKIVGAGLLSAAAGATAGATLIHLTYGTPYGVVWPTWWIADVMGFAIITPVVLSASWSEVRRIYGKQRLESMMYGLLIIAMTSQVFTQSSYTTLLYSIGPLLLWCGYRLGVFGCALLGVIITAIAVTLTLQGSGPLNHPLGWDASLGAIQELQLFLGIVILPALIIGIEREKQLLTEAQLSQYRDHLAHMVESRTAELTAANQQLQQEINERKQVEAALRHSEEQLRLTTDALPVLIAYVDAQQHYRFNNRAYEDWYGKSVSDIYGCSIQAVIGEALYQRIQPYVEAVLSGEPVSFEIEITNETSDSRWVDADYIPHLGEQGEVKGFFALMSDISERKAIERMKDEFISVVSHELRTPLTSLHGSLKLLAAGQLDSRSEEGRQMLKIADESTDRLVRLVNDVLDLQRIESGRVQLDFQVCDAADLMRRATEAMQGMAQQHGVALSTSPISILIQADPDYIVQTLANLLSNAIKFSSSGGTVWLTVEVVREEIGRGAEGAGEADVETQHVASWEMGKMGRKGGRRMKNEERRENSKIQNLKSKIQPPYALFSVRDQGEGIPADKLERVFERFHQVDASDSRKRGGTGLGLAICRKIIEQHGGVIWAESDFGKGSAFYFTVPIAS
ncbi:MAG: ATP-binding protein [Leptolyngbyaceae cyanobacterium MO_188.B28]|nr:ATP-binding protein [Leptolyngbyaceae cyanobacterium MO_188.B28]